MTGANKVITLGGQIVLAWLLTPADMGIAGMAMAMTGFAAFLGAGSVGDVLVQRGRFEEEAGQGLWLSLLLSFGTALVILCLAPLANLLGHGALSGMILVLALLPLADALTPILSASLKTRLQFKYFAISTFVSGAVYTSCTLLFALMGMGPYALIIPVIPRALAFGTAILLRTGWPPIERPKWKIIKKLLKPSLSLSLTGFLSGLQMQAPVFFVGLVLSSTGTGHFSWGWMVASQAVFLLAVNLRQVLMPILTKMAHDPDRQVGATFRVIHAITAVLILACGLQALLAEPLLNRFFPGKWHAAGPVIAWISVGLAFQGIYICVSSWLNAAGKYKELLVITSLPVLVVSGLAYLGASWRGAEGAAWGSAVGIAFSSLLSMAFMPWNAINNQVRNFGVPLILCGIWVLLRFLISNNGDLVPAGTYAALFFGFCVFVWWLWGDEDLKRMAISRFKRFGLSN